MTTLIALGAGAIAYLLFSAAAGYWYGEAPGRLARLFRELQGGPSAASRTTRDSLLRNVRWWLLGRGYKRRELLTAQFGLALQAMAASLRAGASLRTAVERAATDLERMLAGQPLTPMVSELRQVVRDLELGCTLEEALLRLRDRLQLEDVNDFVGAVLLCRVRGGNAAAVIARIAEIIQDKIRIRQQILALTAGKRAEGKLFTFGPPALVAVLAFTSPGYMAPLFDRPLGRLLLVLGAGCLVAAYWISRRLLDIEV